MESAQNAPAPTPDPAPVPATTPVSEAEAAEAVGAEAEAGPAAAPRRRVGRTVALIAVAAVLGIIGGTAVGYGIQADREPTPLPALNQPGLAYPAKPLPKGQQPVALSAAEDRQAKADGDLRKLLVPRPAGAREAEFAPDDGWQDLASYAAGFKDESWMLEFLNESAVRRIAVRAWDSGEHRTTTVQLVQFRPSDLRGAVDHAEDQMSYMDEEKYAGNGGDALKGSGNGRYYLYPVDRKAGYLDLYQARAIFQRGDVMVDIHIFDTKKISKNDIRTLAEKQLERL
ncbi:hypothetical protein ACFY7C_34750 [Streptomyces sp. NPDC012769]|uniref:hypothetical protein n=1 Tax=Streptomyces sp. NPDC012769 TaxID=3364848 RepID=UPI0036B97E17